MKTIKLGPRALIMPMPTALIGTMIDGRVNFMTAAYVGVVNASPPVVSVGIRPARHTVLGIEANGEFSLCLPPSDLVKETDYCGLVSGKHHDKSALFQTFTGESANAPLIAECPINLECRVIEKVDLPTHRVFFGQVIESHVWADCLKDGAPDLGKVNPMLYSTGDHSYWSVGRLIAPAYTVGKELKGG